MNKINIIKEINSRQLRTDIPAFKSGDIIKVSTKIIENNKTRIQNFQGIVMQRRGDGINSTFTVRKLSSNIGVEKTFALHSPIINIEVIKKGKVRRNKITYMRNSAYKNKCV